MNEARPETTSDRRTTRRQYLAQAGSIALLALTVGCPPLELERPRQGRRRRPDSPASSFEVRLRAALAALEARRLSVLVAVSHAGERAVTRELGALAHDRLPAGDTLLDLNSVTKTVTAVMIMKLVEQGRLTLEDRLADLLRGVPDDKADVTVHQLLTHTAGFDEYVGDDHDRIDRATFLELALTSRLIDEPGALHAYSNTGYGVLAAVLEERSRRSYEDYLRRELLAGTGIAHTGYASVYDDARSMRSARGATIAQASWGGPTPGWNLVGNGGLVSTLEDMLRFRRALVAGQLIARELVALMQTPHVREEEGTERYYGYGMVVQEVEGIGRIYHHDGGNDVFSAYWADYVDQGDLVLTAGADTRRGNAIDAMAVLAAALYGVDPSPQ